MPALSVIIPLYNHENSIEQALDSIASQSISLEIIVVNDLSTDNGPSKVEKWRQGHDIKLTLLHNEQKLFALKSRLKGLEYACAKHVMFMDADDILHNNKGLSNALEEMLALDCDIVHFRSTCEDPQGNMVGEAMFNAPLSIPKLTGKAVFEAYTDRKYPPVTLWGKIYTANLLKKLSPLAMQEKIFRLEDKFFVSLCMLYANSYCGSNAYVYHYKLSDIWTIEKYSGRLHDLLTIHHVLNYKMQENNISAHATLNFNNFIKNRMTNNMGLLCILISDTLYSNKKNKLELLEKIATFLNIQSLLSILLLSICINAQRLKKIESLLFCDSKSEKISLQDCVHSILECYYDLHDSAKNSNQSTPIILEKEFELAAQVINLCEILQKQFAGHFPNIISPEGCSTLLTHEKLEDILFALFLANANIAKRLQKISAELKMN